MPPPLTESEKDDIRRVAAEVGRRPYVIGRRVGRPAVTIRKVLEELDAAIKTGPLPPPPASPTLPDPDQLAGGPGLPDPYRQTYDSFRFDVTGRVLILSDIHLPFHDKRAVEIAVAEGQRAGCVGVLLNGDTFDFYGASRYAKEPDKPRIKDELMMGREFLRWLRSRFPHARIVFKEGNHDERFRAYLADRAPDVFELEELHLPNVVKAAEVGVGWVGDKRPVRVGKLTVLHGHEYRGSGGVNPARWLFLRTHGSAMCGHFHQPSFHPARSIDGKEIGVWSTGCLSHLHPQYAPLNNWRHGYAVVEVAADGGYQVANRSILADGRVV